MNTYLPAERTPDMDRYLYAPLKRYSENGGKRHRPLICIAACLAVFIKRATPTGGFGRGGVVSNGDRVTYEGKSLTPGMIKEMNVGDSIETVEPKSAGSDAPNS